MKKVIVAIGIVQILLAALVIARLPARGASASLPPPALQGEIAGSGDTINFQGQLLDSNGNPVAPGNYNMRFTVCNDANCVNPPEPWGPTEFTAAVDAEGLFNVLLIGLDANDFTGDRWLRVEVQDPGTSVWDDMIPYRQMTSVSLSIGNIRKNVVDESKASSTEYILTIKNQSNGGGVKGESIGGVGVYGVGGTTGVYGEGPWGVDGYSPNWRGVYGHSPSGTGVHGESGTGPGVHGESGAGYGLQGVSQSHLAVLGYGPGHRGVEGQTMSGTGVGVAAFNLATVGAGYGVYADSYAPDGYGVAAFGQTAVYGETRNTETWEWAGYFKGDVYVVYDVSALNYYYHPPRGGQERTLYLMGSPEAWFEDFGRATLVNGQAVVEIEPLFAETVNLEVDYHLFLTPLSQQPVLLFVTDQTPMGFTVQGVTLAGHPAACSFDYRIVAKRLGYEGLRMEPAPTELPHPSEVTPSAVESPPDKP